MDTWNQRGLISDSGKSFLIAALDPFHDGQIENLSGFPDMETSPSLVRLVKQSVTISKPAGLPAGNWDCQVVCWPWFKQMGFDSSGLNRQNNYLGINRGGPVQNFGGLQVFAVPPGTEFDGDSNVNLKTVNALTLSDEILQGSNRLIGAGYEIHDTTAQINKQGAICNYMMHNVPRDSSIFTIGATSTVPPAINPIANVFSGTSFRNMPKTTAEALLIPGSVEWEAKDGVYAVCRFQGVDNPPYTVDYNLPVLFEADDVPSSCTNLATPGSAPTYPNTSTVLFPSGIATPNLARVPAWKSFPIHTSGSILTGLSENTTFRLNFNCIVENFPGPRDQKDLSIATPSASFDPRALEILSFTLGHAPIAVPVGENPLGEWFLDVASDVSKFLIGTGHPLAMAIGGAGVAATKAIGSYMTTPSGKPIKAKQPKKKANKNSSWEKGGGGNNRMSSASAPVKKSVINKKPQKTFSNAEWSKLSNDQRKKFKDGFRVTIW